MPTGDDLIATVRQLRAHEAQAEVDASEAWTVAYAANQRASVCRAAREAAEAALLAFADPAPPPLRFEDVFPAQIKSALAASAAHRAGVTASAG